MTDHQHTHRLADDQFDVLADGVAMLIAELRIANRSATGEPDHSTGPAVEPWTFYSPHHKGDVAAFLDDANQLRHIPANHASEVPAGWRRVYLGI